MSLYNGPPRPGARGGRGEFSWDNVKADKDREYYLGHSVKATTGRWAKGKDVFWYTKGKGESGVSQDELEAVKAREREMMAEALGLKPKSAPQQLKQPSLEKHEVEKLLKGAAAEADEPAAEGDRVKGLGFASGSAVAVREEVHEVMQGTGLPGPPGTTAHYSAAAASAGTGANLLTAEQLARLAEVDRKAARKAERKDKKRKKEKKKEQKKHNKHKHHHSSSSRSSESGSEREGGQQRRKRLQSPPKGEKSQRQDDYHPDDRTRQHQLQQEHHGHDRQARDLGSRIPTGTDWRQQQHAANGGHENRSRSPTEQRYNNKPGRGRASPSRHRSRSPRPAGLQHKSRNRSPDNRQGRYSRSRSPRHSSRRLYSRSRSKSPGMQGQQNSSGQGRPRSPRRPSSRYR